jgi:ABC-type dipeptide/oligopeptide/nickel transport system permease component
MRIARVTIERLAQLIPVVVGISLVTFILVRLVPGDPARQLAGPFASQQAIDDLRVRMGLNGSEALQYWRYVVGITKGDLGYSWFNQSPVLDDLLRRFPATLELISSALILSILIFVPLGMLGQLAPNRLTKALDRGILGYGLLSGSLPDFLLGLILLFVFFHLVGIAPAPLGRLNLADITPPHVTGFYTIDALAARQWETFGSALAHLALPTLTLTLVYGSAILKMTQATVTEVMQSPFISAARMLRLPRSTIVRYALRNSLPPMVTIIAVVYGFLIGGAVLVETIFAWGGIGQYAVQSVINSDYVATQGFVIFTAVIVVLIYLVVDILYVIIDPRAE